MDDWAMLSLDDCMRVGRGVETVILWTIAEVSIFSFTIIDFLRFFKIRQLQKLMLQRTYRIFPPFQKN